MSSDTQDHDSKAPTPSVREDRGEEAPIEATRSSEDNSLDEIESRLIELADEMSEVIEGGPVVEREALHDYAVSLVRDRLPVAAVGLAGTTREGTGSQGSGAASLFGYGILLIPVGLVLVPVFGLVGFALLLAGVVLASLGVVSGLVGRVK